MDRVKFHSEFERAFFDSGEVLPASHGVCLVNRRRCLVLYAVPFSVLGQK